MPEGVSSSSPRARPESSCVPADTVPTALYAFLNTGSAQAAPRQAPQFPTFFSALGATPNTNYGKEIVEALRLQTTLSNPKLALTVFMPEDKVGGYGGEALGQGRARCAVLMQLTAAVGARPARCLWMSSKAPSWAAMQQRV